MEGIALAPDQERVAASLVIEDGYRTVGEVVDAALELLQRREASRAEFRRGLEEAIAEADRDGVFTLDEVMAELNEIIAAQR